MSNLNNYVFAEKLKEFEKKVIEPQKKRVDEAFKVMSDVHYQWKDDEQKKAGQAKLDSYRIWLNFSEDFYCEAKKLCVQHENLTNKICKWYECWRNDVSNEGIQETEIMSAQADKLNELFAEMYSELKVLGLNIKPPRALNLK